MQIPFNPKDWTNSIPAWLLAFGFLSGIGVWTAKQLGLTRIAGEAKSTPTGDTDPSIWHRRFDDLEKQIESTKLEHVTAVRDLTKAINDLTMTLLRGK